MSRKKPIKHGFPSYTMRLVGKRPREPWVTSSGWGWSAGEWARQIPRGRLVCAAALGSAVLLAVGPVAAFFGAVDTDRLGARLLPDVGTQ